MLQIIVTTAIAVGTTVGPQALNAARAVVPKITQGAKSGLRAVQNVTRKLATVTPNNTQGALQSAPAVGRLGAGLGPVIAGLTVTLAGCGGGGGGEGGEPTVTSPPVVSESPPPPAPSADCTCAQLSWDPSQEADLAGYTVHIGQSPGSYDPRSDWNVSSNNAMIHNLQRGRTYYFAVSAYDTSGNDSANSHEVSKTISMTAQ